MKAPFPIAVLLGLLAGGLLQAAEPLPPRPERYVEDNAHILSAATVSALNARLDAFERATSDQVLVATFPSVPSDYQMEDFTQRTAEAWGVGQKERDNGAVLFVFPNDRKMRIEVGYGLEGAIPDATAFAIINDEIKPAFRGGDFDGGVTRGIDAILAAARGEYRGTGRTNADRDGETDLSPGGWLIFLLVLIFIGVAIASHFHRRDGTDYSRRGRRRARSRWWDWPSAGGGFGGGSSSGGGWSSGGGGSFGGFSGGGGSFGGGGASGGW